VSEDSKKAAAARGNPDPGRLVLSRSYATPHSTCAARLRWLIDGKTDGFQAWSDDSRKPVEGDVRQEVEWFVNSIALQRPQWLRGDRWA
jgi:hypothetical protein